ncbi:MAG: PEP-CTERM sorting domain-containing protein [Gammaproteobacteria bacterium]|nr:PEP-CTERM sorting domain-containing protein [Gammaproteobacteria bacterium]NND38637.1 PEP-CTERM sorting domain-containing protein [Pseudomonadales bacterium]NNM11715.1 PEP-CTERM sorting domain-containing protein [Pseudomonadales bacterium]RZV56212.1 MAG: PEP-CTERM sorting domain-containing protein [Pseudomonadales bacterium]
MIFKKLVVLAGQTLAMGTVVLSQSAMAGMITHTFDFTADIDHKRGESLGHHALFMEDGLGLKVSALEMSSKGKWKQNKRDVWQDGWAYGRKGLGVKGSKGDNWEIDGLGADEGLQLSFDWAVELLSIKTWFGDRNDDWNLSVKQGGDWINLLDDSHHSSFNNSGIWTKDVIVWADHSNDSLSLKKIMVGDRKQSASVSEPGAISLMGIGLLGLWYSRRRA